MWRAILRRLRGKKPPPGEDYVVFDIIGFRVISADGEETAMNWTDVRTIIGGVVPSLLYEVLYLRFESDTDWIQVDDLVRGFPKFMLEVETRFGVDPGWYGALARLDASAEMLLFPRKPQH